MKLPRLQLFFLFRELAQYLYLQIHYYGTSQKRGLTQEGVGSIILNGMSISDKEIEFRNPDVESYRLVYIGVESRGGGGVSPGGVLVLWGGISKFFQGNLI